MHDSRLRKGAGCDALRTGSAARAHVDAMIRYCHNQVTLGSNILFAPDVHIYAATHSVDVAERRAGLERAYPVTIGNEGAQSLPSPHLPAAWSLS